uniref:Gasdermin bGSDM n=1 Tax=Thermosporothrix sp. COM3 TaxID=2490863 RepID=A0A455SFI1_9CHLR|nr:hypothetical protein KTC_08320 [Thermosporothrix sp. COM3]
MFKRRGSLINYLQPYGYCGIYVPRLELQPLAVLARQEDGSLFGNIGLLTSIVGSGTPIPFTIQAGEPFVPLSGSISFSLGAAIGMDFLGNMLTVIQGADVKLELQVKKGSSLHFSFEEVLQDRVELLQIENYLKRVPVRLMQVGFARDLQRGKLYIVTSTLRSAKFSVTFEKARAIGLELGAKTPWNVGEGTLTLSELANTSTARMTYNGPRPLVFGFQAVQAVYSSSSYNSLKLLKSEAMRGTSASGYRMLNVEQACVLE